MVSRNGSLRAAGDEVGPDHVVRAADDQQRRRRRGRCPSRYGRVPSSQSAAGIQTTGAPIGSTDDATRRPRPAAPAAARRRPTGRTWSACPARARCRGCRRPCRARSRPVTSISRAARSPAMRCAMPLQVAGQRVAGGIEEERDHQRQQELQQAAGDAEQHLEPALGQHAEIGLKNVDHHAEVGRPAGSSIRRCVGPTSGTRAQPGRRARQAGRQRVLDRARAAASTSSAPAGAASAERQHDQHGGQQHHHARRPPGLPQLQVHAQPARTPARW